MPPLTRSGERDGGSDGGDGGNGRSRKRRKLQHAAPNRKLVVGEEVEVRFNEDGLKGSWNPGVVIDCANCIRTIKYNEMLEEGGARNLVESISVSAAIEGLSEREAKNHRGFIRPIPPCHNVDATKMSYGMCVDALVNDAWWEGVIMDDKEGSSTRLVFFPDLGDQHAITSEKMRLTFDWDEVSGDWRCRGRWVLLDLGVFPISIRQVWYLLSSTVSFHQKIGDWVLGSISTWKQLVSEIIKEALYLSHGQAAAVDDLCPQINNKLFVPLTIGTKEQCPSRKVDAPLTTFEENNSTKCISDGINTDGNFSPAVERTDKLEIPVNEKDFPFRPSDNELISEQRLHALMDFINEYRNRATPTSLPRRRKDARNRAKQYLLEAGWNVKVGPTSKYYVSPSGDRCLSFIKACEIFAAAKNADKKSTTETAPVKHAGVKKNRANTNNEVHKACPRHLHWQLEDIVGEYYPEAISDYNLSKLGSIDTRTIVKKHLVSLGWRIYHKPDKSAGKVFHRFDYCSPDGRCFSSLQKVCQNLMEEHKAKMHFKGAYDGKHSNLTMEYHNDKKNPILDYVKSMESRKLKQAYILNENISQKRLKAKTYLQNSGWNLWYLKRKDNNGKESRYSSPRNKCFRSLLNACKEYLNELKENGNTGHDSSVAEGIQTYKMLSFHHDRGSQGKSFSSTDLTCNILQDNLCQPYVVTGCSSGSRSTQLQFGEKKVIKLQRRQTIKGNMGSKHELLSSSPLLSDHGDGQNSKKRNMAQPSIKHDCRSHSHPSSAVLQPRKQSKSDLASFAGLHRARTILSLLIDNNILHPREKVHYLSKRDKSIMMEGWITRDGIQCMCCNQLFSLSKFEIHAGSSNHRPSANIFLEDGRSLLDCQKEMADSIRPKHISHRRVKSDYSNHLSDGICSICQDGGILVLCDHCPSSFHLNCVGLKDVPTGNWFCPSCKCTICGLSEFNRDTGMFMEDTKLYCDQCEREFHVGCLRKNGMQELKSCPEGFWFCSEICSKIFHELHELVGKSNPTSVDGLSWSLLRSNKAIGIGFNKLDVDTRTENHSKLQVALDVLHECFLRITEPRTGTDLVADLLCNKESELKRLNFWGFYTIVLEKEDEIISVASFRVFGEKAAEMPLVGTRTQYRHRGMCRLLIAELEKLLFSFGVERLLLPAVPELLETWTSSFGFSIMTHSERMLLSEYIFLNFQGTTMCQKPVNLLSIAADRSRECHKMQNDASDVSNDEVNCDSHAIVPEVFHMVRPIDQLHSHAEDVIQGENGFQKDANHFSPIESCLDHVPLAQVADESQKDLVADDILTKWVSRSLSF